MSLTIFPVLTSVVLSPKGHADQTIAGGLIITDYLSSPQVLATDHFQRPGSGPSDWTATAFSVSNGAYNAFEITGQGSLVWGSTAAADTPPDVELRRSAARTLSIESLDATPAALQLNGSAVLVPYYGTSPPPSPADGQIWIFPADATNGILWQFRYRSGVGVTYPWESIGGSPLNIEVLTDDAIASPQTSYQTGGTPVQLTIPRTGVYDIANGCTMYANGPNTLYFTIGTAATGWTDTDCVQMYMASTLTAVTGMRTLRRTYTAAEVVIQKYRNVSAVATDAFRRWMQIRPVRVS